jgi:hypothetical protein
VMCPLPYSNLSTKLSTLYTQIDWSLGWDKTILDDKALMEAPAEVSFFPRDLWQ